MRAAFLASAVLALLAGCGGDDEGRVRQETAGATAPVTSPTQTTPTATAPGRDDTVGVPADDLTTPTSPEDAPGGAGDEQAARSQAQFTGRGGGVRPRVVQVPPFIAVRVELRSADGRTYRLRFGRRTLAAGPGTRPAALTFDGLRPGRRLVGAGSARVVIEASAEPGP